MKSRGQAAMEYLVLTGFTMLIIMILLVAAYTKMTETDKQVDIDSFERAANRLKAAADFAYMHGHPTKLTISVYLPGDAESRYSYMDNNTINFAVNVKGAYTDVWRSTLGNVGWDLSGSSSIPDSEGYYTFVVETISYDAGTDAGRVNIHR